VFSRSNLLVDKSSAVVLVLLRRCLRDEDVPVRDRDRRRFKTMDNEERRWRIAVAISPRHVVGVVGVVGSNRRFAAAPFRTSRRSPSGWRSSSPLLIAVWVAIVLVGRPCRSHVVTRFFLTSRDCDQLLPGAICGAARPGTSCGAAPPLSSVATKPASVAQKPPSKPDLAARGV
jgi:hypothetical protein